LGFGGLKTLKF